MIIDPTIYHGVLLPYLELVLSDKTPTIGVVIASAIYPPSIAYGANFSFRISFKKKRR